MSEKQKTVRTVSQLDEVRSLNANQDRILFEVSIPRTDAKYTSNKCSYVTLMNHISSDTDNSMAYKYNLGNETTRIDGLGMNNRITKLESNDMSIGGKKTFTQIPTSPLISLDTDKSITDDSITNVDMVRQIVSKYGSFYSSTSRTEKSPLKYTSTGGLNGSVYEEHSEGGTPLYYWHIDDGQKDSSLFIDDEFGSAAVGSVQIKKTGMLTIYGWLADKGNVKAQESWVGLFASIYDESIDNERWMPLQIVPWIQGVKHALLQYVGFNVSVRIGMKLKIMTGFSVNGSNSELNDGDCLLFKDVENMPNTFIGYVIENTDVKE